jgi:hypothetical protein
MSKVYTDTIQTARDFKELDEYKKSMEENRDCCLMIADEIGKNYNNNRLDCTDVISAVTAKYGTERTMLMLACRVNSLNWDGRIGRDNKVWAQDLVRGIHNLSEISETADIYLGRTHVGLIDMLTRNIRIREEQSKTFENAFAEIRELSASNDRSNENFTIIDSVRLDDNLEIVLGQNKSNPNGFVTWQCKNGNNYDFGNYFPNNSLAEAKADLYQRAAEWNRQFISKENSNVISVGNKAYGASVFREIHGVNYEIELTQSEAENIAAGINTEDLMKDIGYRIEWRAEDGDELIESTSFSDEMIAQIADKYESDRFSDESYWLELDTFIDEAANEFQKNRNDENDNSCSEPEQ